MARRRVTKLHKASQAHPGGSGGYTQWVRDEWEPDISRGYFRKVPERANAPERYFIWHDLLVFMTTTTPRSEEHKGQVMVIVQNDKGGDEVKPFLSVAKVPIPVGWVPYADLVPAEGNDNPAKPGHAPTTRARLAHNADAIKDRTIPTGVAELDEAVAGGIKPEDIGTAPVTPRKRTRVRVKVEAKASPTKRRRVRVRVQEAD